MKLWKFPAHTLMGKGCLQENHPLLLGMAGFWGVANTFCREADLILATGTRLAERFQFVGSAFHFFPFLPRG